MSMYGRAKDLHLVQHKCNLSEGRDGLVKLSPNAPLMRHFFRWLRKLLCPNPKLAISRRDFRNTSQIYAEGRRHARSKFFYIIHPYSDMEFYRELLFLVICVWKIITAPVIASFTWVSLYLSEMSNHKPEFLQYPEMVIFALGIVWILSCFFAGYRDGTGKISVELNHFKIVKRYITTYFLVDLIIFLPQHERIYVWSFMYWINLVAVFRYYTVLIFLARFLKDLKVSENLIIFISMILLSYFLTHIFTCLFYLIPLITFDGEGMLWVYASDLHPHQSITMIYVGCYSMVQSHFWGLGGVHKHTSNNSEELILTVVMIVGRLWSLSIIAALLRLFTISSLSESKYEQYLMQLQTFIAHNNIPEEMEEKLLKYYEYTFQNQFFNEKSIFGAMSHYLRQELILFRARNVINKVSVFKYFSRSMIASIISKSKVLVFLNNDYVIKEGDIISHVYFISWGTVAVFNQDNIELVHMSDGDEIGIKGVNSTDIVRFRFTYISTEVTEIYSISCKDFRKIIYSKSDILRFFENKVNNRIQLWNKIETIVTAQGVDLLSELRHEKLLERPRIRTRVFEL